MMPQFSNREINEVDIQADNGVKIEKNFKKYALIVSNRLAGIR
jgi:hypothetical protein